MPGLDFEDKDTSITGDPPPTRPLSPAQMKGAQQATVNRTRGGPPGGGRFGAVQQPPEQPQNGDAGGGKDPGQPNVEGGEQQPAGKPDESAGDFLGTQLGALAKVPDAWRTEADQALDFNPAHNQDWWKRGLEGPVETYFMGKHLFNAFYNAFLDPNAIQTSVHDIWHQDNAVGWLLRNQTFDYLSGIQGGAAAFGTTPENFAAASAATVLPITADPANVAYMGGSARGAALVARWMAPTAVNAIFGDKHSATDLAWGILPAMLFGGKLPPSVMAQVEKVAPAAGKLIERMSAAKMAQDANKLGVQERDRTIKELLAHGAMSAKSAVLAKMWEKGIEPLTKAEEKRLESALLDRYGSLDPDKVVPRLIADGASPRLLNNVWTKLLKMPYDLLHVAPEEAPLIDPRSHRILMKAPAAKAVQDGFQWSWHMINQSALGTAGHAADPNVSRFRSLLGLQQTDKLTEQMWVSHLREVAGEEADKPEEWARLSKALESSGPEQEAAYLSLSWEMKYVRDSMRMVAAGIGQAGEEAGLYKRVHNFWPRVGLLVKDEKGYRPLRRGPATLTSLADRHRTLGVRAVDSLTESRMQVEQAYKTVREANDAIARQREYVVGAIMNGTPWKEIASETGAGVSELDSDLIEKLQVAAGHEPEIVRKQAQEYAERILPQFSENPFDGIAKLGRQMRAITSANAITDLLSTKGQDGKSLAIRRPGNSRAYEEAMRQGYKSISIPGFQSVLVNAQYGKLLEDAQKAADLGGFKAIADLENKAVTMIMFSPRIHGLNMAGRLGLAFAMHPMEVSRWFAEGLLQKGGLSSLGLKGTDRIGPEEYRMIPRRKGLVPPNPHMGASGMFSGEAQNAVAGFFGDIDIGRVPLLRDMANSPEAAKASSGAKQVLGSMRNLLWGKQEELWSWVSDFGVMMWWIEHAAAQRGGMLGGRLSGEEVARYATARANSWMGHVAPYDWNPNLHAALKTALFAPNWWRTWGELLTGYYRNQGFGWSRDTIRYVVENEIKTAMAAVLFQQMSANVLNTVFSGHSIYQNDPGNWGKIEITAPWAIEALNATVLKDQKIDPKTGRDAKGAKWTWENPLARQMTDTEQMMGLLTSSPNWSPETLKQGFLGFAAARTSPVAQAFAALGNIDLYRSISSGGARYVDPNHDTLAGNPLADAITALGDLTPFSYVSQQIQQQIMQGDVGEIQGPFGLPIPKAVLDAFTPQSLASDAVRSMLVGLTGVNPPFMRSSRSFGTSPTDDQYKAVHEIQDQYQQRMTALSTSSLSGQMAPYQWLAVYRNLSAEHAAQMQAIFMHAPEYNNGPLGLTSSYESLYDQATDRQGVLHPDKLRSLQQQWRNEHSAADFTAVRNELRANDAKYPMLALYHKTLDAYDNWQSDWCAENGIDRAKLQSDLSGWSAVYNDRRASQQWLVDHPELQQFENAKRAEFESGSSRYGMAGLMYALFFNPSAADQYLAASGETKQQVEQQVQSEQVPAAP